MIIFNDIEGELNKLCILHYYHYMSIYLFYLTFLLAQKAAMLLSRQKLNLSWTAVYILGESGCQYIAKSEIHFKLRSSVFLRRNWIARVLKRRKYNSNRATV